MEITGRVTKDALVKKTKDNRELVAFTIVVNDSYKIPGKDRIEIATFFNCSYWLSTNVAKVLKKGSIVSLFGHVGINSYKGSDNIFYANLTFHVNHFKIIECAKKNNKTEDNTRGPTPGTKDDLPF